MTKKDVSGINQTTQGRATGPWDDPALAKLREWDPDWAETYFKMTTNPWTSGVLPPKLLALIGIALNVACRNLNPDGTRRHIRAALEADATREEILMVLKMASIMSISSFSQGPPILLEEASESELDEASDRNADRSKISTRAVDKMKALGQWESGMGSHLHACPSVD